ncbi:hypothetical protein EDD16DRAFT_460454 [Pisolithus croceorrhizus]|nr:hypothetical protein EDD16DRAFT_460454 [Pisolithus croceorrhizus]
MISPTTLRPKHPPVFHPYCQVRPIQTIPSLREIGRKAWTPIVPLDGSCDAVHQCAEGSKQRSGSRPYQYHFLFPSSYTLSSDMLPGRPAQAQYVLTTESCCDPWSCMQTAKLSVSIRVPACMYWLRESHRSEKYETERCRMAVLILRGQHTSCSFGVEPPCSPESSDAPRTGRVLSVHNPSFQMYPSAVGMRERADGVRQLELCASRCTTGTFSRTRY